MKGFIRNNIQRQKAELGHPDGSLHDAVTSTASGAGRWLNPRNPLTGQFPANYPRAPRGRVTLHWGPRFDAHLLIPEIP